MATRKLRSFVNFGSSLIALNSISVSWSNCDADSSRIITRAEVSSHNNLYTGIWVIYGPNVYDVTSFLSSHPGGKEKLLLAAGKNVEPYWRVYRQHYNSKLPQEILETLKIGELPPEEVQIAQDSNDESNNPYAKDPQISPIFKVLQNKPINAEPPESTLTDSWITSNDLFFVRNHHPVPIIPADEYRLTLSVHGENIVEFSLDDLKTKFPKHSVTTTVQCGGNRRKEMNAVHITAGSPWNVGAISTATWSGVLLSDILSYAGVDTNSYEGKNVHHVQFTAWEDLESSIPISKAINPRGDCLLAFEMNGVPIPVEHGFPIRSIVPGHVGIRNVKWLKKINLSHEESHGTWQRGMAYKGLPPSAKTLEGIDVEKIPSLQEQPVQSAIVFPEDGSTVIPGVKNTIKGYAYSGGGRGIVRVDVSVDGGKTWHTVTLTDGSEQPLDRAWAWTFWEADIFIPEDWVNKETEIICKATDASYNVQPDSVEGIWNLRGINNNSWHRVNVTVREDEEVEDN